jgi:hypothetical protein
MVEFMVGVDNWIQIRRFDNEPTGAVNPHSADRVGPPH